MPRNEARSRGKTRKQHIVEQLSAIGVGSSTIVYVDEWGTGKNFYTICQALRSGLPVESSLYPFALLKEESQSNPRWLTFKAAHDRLLAKVAISEGRFTLPQMTGRFTPTEYFFWGEQDRLAGFRKMQVTGSALSNLRRLAELFATDATARERIRAELAELRSGGGDLDELVLRDVNRPEDFSKMLRVSAAAFLEHLPTLSNHEERTQPSTENEFIQQLALPWRASCRRQARLGARCLWALRSTTKAPGRRSTLTIGTF